MPARSRQLVYYQLLKASGAPQVLDFAIDVLADAPVQLATPLHTQLDGLLKTAQELGVLSQLDVARHCAEVASELLSDEEAAHSDAVTALSRALEAAGVAYAISGLFGPPSAPAGQRPCWRQELQALLLARGDQVLQEVAARVDAFRLKFLANTRALEAALHGLLALRQAGGDAYAIVCAHCSFRRRLKAASIRKSLSTFLSEAHQELVKTPKAGGRSAFTVEVAAGLERLSFAPAPTAAAPSC